MTLYAPDLESCVAACASYNMGYLNNLNNGVKVGGGMCKAVALLLGPGEGCWLKNGTGKRDTGKDGRGIKVDSAALLE